MSGEESKMVLKRDSRISEKYWNGQLQGVEIEENSRIVRPKKRSSLNSGLRIQKNTPDKFRKTSQELGNCPMGQREALLKERLY